MDTTDIVEYILRHTGDIGICYLVALVANDGIRALPELLLAAKLNVAAVPLAGVGVLNLHWWQWYVIVVLWALQLVHFAGYDLEDAVRLPMNASRRVQYVLATTGVVFAAVGCVVVVSVP